MNKHLLTWTLMATTLTTGCNQETAGGPGATGSNKNRSGEETFKISTPMLSNSLKQGESKTIDIKITRNKNFDEDVKIKFAELPKGVVIEPASPVIKHGEQEAKINIKAADDAALGDFTAKVIGQPTKGSESQSDLKLSVEKR